MTPEVETAIDELKAQFQEVKTVPDGNGGSFVTVEDIDLGDKFEPPVTWFKFHIVPTYPVADTYPHFIQPNVRLSGANYPDVSPMGEATTLGNYSHGEDHFAAIQLSRKSNQHNPATDTACLKLLKVIDWLKHKS